MEKSIIKTGKTIDIAVQNALTELALDRDSVSVEVLENARTGFLGIGASPAKVKVTYQVPDEVVAPVVPEAPKSALGSASRNAKPKERPETAQATAVISRPGKKPAAEEKPQEPKREVRNDRPKKNDQKPRQNKENKPSEKKEMPKQETVEVPVREYVPAAPGSVEEEIEKFLKGLLERMGSEAVAHAYKVDDESYRADLVGSDVGLLIGRRGDTLDAIQYLTSYSINRERNNRIRVSVDAGGYRYKREEALQQLAKKMAAKAAKYHRNFTLEPMNAYERHIIHATLQDYPDVTTFSTGTEPHRRIVVAYAKNQK